jgi:hypothetical protein
MQPRYLAGPDPDQFSPQNAGSVAAVRTSFDLICFTLPRSSIVVVVFSAYIISKKTNAQVYVHTRLF